MAPWHRVLLKQPGAVPAGAGIGGNPAGLFCDPEKWHPAQTSAFAVSVLVCVKAVAPGMRQGLRGCGALTPWQVEQAIPAPPPEKLLPWQIWHEAKPEFPGAFFAEAPCWAGCAQVGMVP